MRDQILAEAWAICRDEGLAALSLRDLASRVGMRAPSLYSYFSSKHDLYDAMFAQGQEELLAAVEGVDRIAGLRARLRAGARTFFDFCVADPVRYQLLFQRVVPGFVPSEASYALAVSVLGQLAAQLRSAGVDDPRLVDLWTAMLSGLTAQQLANDPGGHRWASLVDETVDLFCDHAGIPRDERSPHAHP